MLYSVGALIWKKSSTPSSLMTILIVINELLVDTRFPGYNPRVLVIPFGLVNVTTKHDILSLLQRESLTVVQVCERLGVTRNAVNVQIKQLEAEGLVRRSKLRQRGMLGKPAVLYEAAPGSEDVASNA